MPLSTQTSCLVPGEITFSNPAVFSQYRKNPVSGEITSIRKGK
jgi:hypothetical protein